MKWGEMTNEQKDELIHEKVTAWQPKLCRGPELGKIEREKEPLNTADPPMGLWDCALCGYLGCGDESGYPHNEREDIPDYSTDMNAAWQIVEKLGENLDIRLYMEEGFFGKYCVNIWKRDGGRIAGSGDSNTSMPDAICKAALKACGVQVE